MITQIEKEANYAVEHGIVTLCWWFVHTEDRSNVKPQVRVMQGLDLDTSLRQDGYIHRMIVEQQQCINLSLRDVVNDWLSFKRSMFL